ncbi:MAG: T9SS type A sorting domain-containing protein [Bacteroidales bacterium]|nr:T9SS type A sorting domain-containing protein [Bacteroidales bacterium]
MKNVLLSFAIVFLSLYAVAQQIPREMVLLEIGTGTWCVYCPGAAMGADDLIENGHPVAVIENHNGDPFANTYSNARNSYYAISGYPTAFFDGQNPYVGGSNNQSLYSSYLARVNQRLAVPTSFTVEIFGDNNGDLYEITVRVEKLAEYTGNLVVHLALTESEIMYNWQGQNHLNFVNRLMAPSASGTPLTIAVGEVVDTDLTFTFNNSWVPEHCELVAWVQNNSTKEVVHSNKVALLDLVPGEPTFLADFTSNKTDLCEPGTVKFYDNSIGNPVVFNWSFPGGNPSSSNLENPIVYYSAIGEYDVSLTVANGPNSSTTTKTAYVRLHDAPEVTFAEVPVQCIFWDPHMLSEGQPAGGVYSGTGVVDGYFYPATAGVGQHTITYTYTDQWGCMNSATQVLGVDECTAINEQLEGVSVSLFPNPSQGKFIINLGSNNQVNMHIKVINNLGKIVFQSNPISVVGELRQEIDLSGVAEGIYFVQLEANGKTLNRKIVVRF